MLLTSSLFDPDYNVKFDQSFGRTDVIKWLL